MKLATLIRELTIGQLRELPFIGEGTEPVPVEHLPVLLEAFNASMLALAMRFPIQTRTLVIEAVAGLFQYPLRPEFAITSGSQEPVKFILDSALDPFTGNVLGIERIYNKYMQPLGLNELGDVTGMRMPSHDVVQLEAPVSGDRYYIVYRTAPAPVPVDMVDISDVEVNLPIALTNALKLHIAHLVYATLGMEGAMTKSAMYLQTYEAECNRLLDYNTLNQSVMEDTNQKPRLGGWV